MLFNVVGGPDLSMTEVDEAASIIAKTVDPDADIIFGAVIDDKMIDQIKVTLIATKFDEGKLKMFRFRSEPKQEKLEKLDDEEKKVEDLKDLTPQEDLTDEELFDEDSEFDIPAFLRKK